MTQIIKETASYTLQVAPSVLSDNPNSASIYQITNKKYGVVEIETNMLPSALKYLHDLEAGLAAMEDMYAEDQSAKVLPIYSGRNKVN